MKERIIRISLFVIAVLLLTNCSPLATYVENSNVSIWEKDIKQFETLDKSEQYSDDAILFTGSSSIRLWKTINDDMKPYNVIQRGFGGADLADFVYYLPRIVYPHKFDAIVIFVANDITGSKKDLEPEDVKELFEYAVEHIWDEFPEKQIFWVQVTPTQSRWNVWEETKKSNELIKEYCADTENLNFIETERLFLDENGKPNNQLFRNDQLHLNNHGYAIWAKKIREELNKNLKHKLSSNSK